MFIELRTWTGSWFPIEPGITTKPFWGTGKKSHFGERQSGWPMAKSAALGSSAAPVTFAPANAPVGPTIS
jgi:hypothetical protein